MTNRGRGALILGHNRQALLTQAIEAIRPQVDTVMVIDNASEPRLAVPPGVGTMYVTEQPPNLSRFWNMGLNFFRLWFKERPHDVAVLCDDAIVPPSWFTVVTQAMRATGASIGCSNPWGTPHEPILKKEPDRDLSGRMPGWAWVLDNDSGIRADEQFAWWWGDTDIDWQARAAGGMVMVGSFPVSNEQPDYWAVRKPEIPAQIAIDSQAFVDKYGWRPW